MAIDNIKTYPVQLPSDDYVKAILPTNSEFRKDLDNFTPTASDAGSYFMHCGKDNGNFIPGHIYKVCKTAHKFISDDGSHIMYLRDNAAYDKFMSHDDGDLEFEETWFNIPDADEIYRIPDANPCIIMVDDDGKKLFSRNSEVYYGFLLDTEEVDEVDKDLPFGEYGFVEVTHEGLEYIGSKIEIDPSVIEKTKLGNDVTFSEFIKAINNGGSLGTVFVSEKNTTISADESDLTERVYIKSLLPVGRSIKLVSNIRFKVNDTFGYDYSYEIPSEMLETGECTFDIKIEQDDCYGEALFELYSDEGVIASYSFKMAFSSPILTAGLAPHGTYWVQNLDSPSFSINDFVDSADTRRIADNFHKINVRFAESDDDNNYRVVFIPLPGMGDDGMDIPSESIGVKVTDGHGLDLTEEFAPFVLDVPMSGGNYGDAQRPVVIAGSWDPIIGESTVTIEIFDKRIAANYDNLPPEGTMLADGDSLYIVEMRNIGITSLPDTYIEIYCLDTGAKFSYAPGNTFNSLTGYFRAIV